MSILAEFELSPGWPDQKLEIQKKKFKIGKPSDFFSQNRKKIRKSVFLQNSGYYTNMLASIALVNAYSLI